ncbi:DNA internalization-related competence protein ComEC/Rec2, partial [hydrothermal vent metagenome]
VFLFFLVVAIKKGRIKTVCLSVVYVFLGMLYVQSHQLLEKNHIEYEARYFKNKPANIQGVITSAVTVKERFSSFRTSFYLDVSSIEAPWGWKNVKGRVFVNIFTKRNLEYGDLIQVSGKLHYPFEFDNETNFSYRNYLANYGVKQILSVKKTALVDVLEKGKGSTFIDLSQRLRRHLRSFLAQHLSKNEAGLLQAMLLGERSHIPQAIRDLFAHTGTVHILAVSGLHVGVIAGFVFLLIKILPLRREIQIILTIFILGGYVFLAGARPSTVRAGLMTTFFLLSVLLERKQNHLNTLSMTGLILLLINPLNLFDVGFQLSFSCVLAIIVLTPILSPWIMIIFGVSGTFSREVSLSWQYKVRKNIAESVSVSASVWIGVMGLTVYYFGIISPVTVLANLIIVPLMCVNIGLGFGLLTVGSFFTGLVPFFVICQKFCLNLMVAAAFLLNKFPFAYFFIREVTLKKVMVYYVFLVVLLIVICRVQTSRSSIDKAIRL